MGLPVYELYFFSNLSITIISSKLNSSSLILSFKKSMSSQSGQPPEMQQQMKMMFIFMIVMIAFASLSLPTAIALYWIVTNGFAIIQNIIVERKIGKKD